MLPLAVANAQQYPARPITILCWSAPGSPVDIYSRIMAKLLAAELGQNVIVENRAGGSGIIMVNTLLRAPTDGYTIAANTITLAALFSEPTATFKPDDLQMIARSQIDPYGLVVHTSTPFRTIDDLVAFARKKPDYINIGGVFVMSGHRVAWEVFQSAAGIKSTWVPYPGGGPALTAVAGGHVDAATTNPGNVKPMIAAGKVRVLPCLRTSGEDFGCADLQGARMGCGALPVARRHGQGRRAEARRRPARRGDAEGAAGTGVEGVFEAGDPARWFPGPG